MSDPGHTLMYVYRYRYWDDPLGDPKDSRHYATVPAIRDGLGIPLFDSAILVSSRHVVDGIYRPPSSVDKPSIS